ncbi:[histone H3]-lysine4 N-trimethyltransferase ASH1L, partial [Phenoliferia sp. Uapishka_3]
MLRAAFALALSPFQKQKQSIEGGASALAVLHQSSPLSAIVNKDDDASGDESEEEDMTTEPPPSKRPRRSSTMLTTTLDNGKGKAATTSKLACAIQTPSPTSDGSRGNNNKPVFKTSNSSSSSTVAGSSTSSSSSYNKKTTSAVAADTKPWLVAGLYAPSLPEPSKSKRRASAPINGYSELNPSRGRGRKSLASLPPNPLSVHPSGAPLLPLPLHFGATIFGHKKEFRLPFDIRRDFIMGAEGVNMGKVAGDADEAEVERREQSRKPMPYKRISRNVYHERKPDRVDAPHVCECKMPEGDEPGCGDGCFNQMMQYCCSPKSCPCGDKCTNLPLGKREGIPESKDGLRVIWTGDRGFGLKTMVPLKQGQFIMEYRGEIISRDESYRRVLTTYKDAKSYYFLDYDGDEVVDAGQQGNSSRFINHSCGPNVNVVRWNLSDLDEYQIGIFAKHDIPAGTELSYDYGWQDFSALAVQAGAKAKGLGDSFRQQCFCGAAVCTGWMGGAKKDKKDKEKALPPQQRVFKPMPGRKDDTTIASSSKGSSSSKAKAKAKGRTVLNPLGGEVLPRKKRGGSYYKKMRRLAEEAAALAKANGEEVPEMRSSSSSSTSTGVKLAKLKLAIGAARSANKVVGRKSTAHKNTNNVALRIVVHAKPKTSTVSPSSRARFAKDGPGLATRGAVASSVRERVQIVKLLP